VSGGKPRADSKGYWDPLAKSPKKGGLKTTARRGSVEQHERRPILRGKKVIKGI